MLFIMTYRKDCFIDVIHHAIIVDIHQNIHQSSGLQCEFFVGLIGSHSELASLVLISYFKEISLTCKTVLMTHIATEAASLLEMSGLAMSVRGPSHREQSSVSFIPFR
jgi:hypothetical protein